MRSREGKGNEYLRSIRPHPSPGASEAGQQARAFLRGKGPRYGGTAVTEIVQQDDWEMRMSSTMIIASVAWIGGAVTAATFVATKKPWLGVFLMLLTTFIDAILAGALLPGQ